MSEINVYFRISEIIVFDIQNNFFGYLKYVPVLGYPKQFFSDIWNNYFGYLKK